MRDYCSKFWGDPQRRREKLAGFVEHFLGCRNVLDIGCGRGEFLHLLKGAGVDAIGVDNDPAHISRCREGGYQAFQEDMFAFLDGQRKFDGIMMSHVIEHLRPGEVERLLAQSYKALATGGKLVVVTPNPESLAVMTNIFWLDVTHERLYPLPLVVEMCSDAGFEIELSGEDAGSVIPSWRWWVRRRILRPMLRVLGMRQLGTNLFSAPCVFVVARKPTAASTPQAWIGY